MAEDSEDGGRKGKLHNNLPVWGNEQTMNLNPLILANIQSSSYFKVHLFKLKTFHQVVDEIYYQVKHLEPWERGSRKTAGQTGMCGGVRGVGAGGIVSTAFCLLYKLYTLRLTRKQVNGLMSHCDSPFIRALGFMYVRYSQPPGDLFDWYEEYLEDAEEVEPKAGGGQPMTIGNMCKHFLTKLEWFSTLFPRIPVPIQKQIEQRLTEHERELKITVPRTAPRMNASTANNETERYPREQQQHRDNFNYKNDNRDRDRTREREKERDRERFRARHRSRERERDRSRDNRDRDRDRERDRHRERHNRDRSRDRRHR